MSEKSNKKYEDCIFKDKTCGNQREDGLMVSSR